MLVPAILYRDQIEREFQRLYYTKDMLFETGCLGQWTPEISDSPDDGRFDYAIVSNNKLIGYLSYQVDYYVSKAYNFGLMSFDRGNPVVGKDVFEKLEELVSTLHRVEWRMVGGNPAERSYDKFCEKHKEDVIRVMKAHGNILIKKHGFWTYENCEFHKDHNSNIPIFSCQITTLRVLARRNIVTFDENKGICKLN